MQAFQPVRGMRDLIGEEAQTFTHIIAKARETAYALSQIQMLQRTR